MTDTSRYTPAQTRTQHSTRVGPNGDRALWAGTRCPRRFVDDNKCATLVGMTAVRAALRGSGCGNSVLSAQYFCDPKTALKKNSLLKDETVSQRLGPDQMLIIARTGLEEGPSGGGANEKDAFQGSIIKQKVSGQSVRRAAPGFRPRPSLPWGLSVLSPSQPWPKRVKPFRMEHS